MSKARIQDIAQAAGVSPATVTRVLRGNGYASPEKRELVLSAARSLGYDFTQHCEKNAVPQVLIFSHPSHAAKNWLFSNILETICCEIQKLGWYCLTCYVQNGNTDEIIRFIEATRHMNLKGIIFNCLDFPENLPSFRSLLNTLSTPVVMIERFPDVFGVDKIMINAKEAVFLAVRHLYRQGHRKIAFFSPENTREVERSRIEGFKSAVSTMELDADAHFLPIRSYSPKNGKEAIAAYIEAYGMPTAVITADPVMVGISQYLYENHLRIPEDISLLGLDDSIASIMIPSLTSVAFPVTEIARNTIQLLTQDKEENGLSKTISLSTYLIERDTVAPPVTYF